MKRYKLIKEYPGSPKLGTIISQLGTSQFYEDKNNSAIIKQCFDYKIFSKYPEFWKKVIEKDYEILSFSQNSNIKDLWTNFGLTPNCWCRNVDGSAVTKGYVLEQILNNPLYSIHSVKRLSDGEIFTVGDKINYEVINTNKNRIITTKINKFYIDLNNKLRINFDLDRENINTNCYLKDAVKSKVLFRSEDGVDIYEGDVFYIHVIPFNDKNKTNIAHQIATDYYKTYKFKKTELIFSTKEAAEEHILINKPCLSLKDISNYYKYLLDFSNGNNKGLRELVKSKLK